MVEVTGILCSLLLLMFLAWRGVSVLVIAPLCALAAVLCDGNTPLLAAYTQIFMPGVAQFIAKYFPLFLLGSIFGAVMQHSGAARTIAIALTERAGSSRAVPAVVLTCAILTTGGVSVFVVVFAVCPIAEFLFHRANIPRRLIPAAIALGSFTFSMTAIPGSVQLPNLIPMPVFGTTPWAAAVPGLIAAVGMLVAGLCWLQYRVRLALQRDEGYGDEGFREALLPERDLPSVPAALLPVVMVIAANMLFSLWVIPDWDAGYLEEERFGSASLSSVIGTWSALLALLLAVGTALLLFRRSFRNFNNWLTEGAQSSLLPVFNTAVEYGYGRTIAALAGFAAIRTWLGSLSPSSPLISEAVTINVLAGVTGSASGGLSIAMESMGTTWGEQGTRLGTDPELMHRVAALACGGFDSLPHNGAVITLLLICKCTHRESYADIGVVSVLIPFLTTVLFLIAVSW